MILDTSAIVAMLRKEPEASAFARAIIAASNARISAGSWIELGAVLSKDADDMLDLLDQLMEALSISIATVDEAQARLGQSAYRRFGKGRHPAALNFGDCFAYALAMTAGQPLLFKGDDFRKTDVDMAI